MYCVIEYSNNYAKAPESLWQYRKDNLIDKIADSESFIFKARIAERTPAAGNTADVEIAVPLKYLSNFWLVTQKMLK